MKRLIRAVLILLLLLVVTGLAYPLWKPMVRGQRWFIIASNVGLNSLRKMGVKQDQIGQSDEAPPDSQIAPTVQRMHRVYDNYLRYSGMPKESVPGKKVLELGPGFTMSIPLLFAADGAAYVAGNDKFVPFQTGAYYQKYYRRLRETLSPEQQKQFDRAISIDPLALKPDVAGYIYKSELTDVVDKLGPATWDLIVSNAVIEEIYDPMPIMNAQDKLLKPGGAMCHNIDLRDYGMFSKYGYHALEFLTVSDWIYKQMVEASGQPDRRMASYYSDVAKQMGYTSEIWVTHILGHQELLPEPRLAGQLRKGVDYTDADLKFIADIRPRLQPQFQKMSDEELLAQSIIFVAHKPAK